ncbi:RNA pseudouridylate synthase domain-containing protein 2 [Clonorchis sinensis]|uniref:RNA pseudouridylate synthase domain-containing protein 2 n=1 Tax=Clonorchis sinensis TaxID=79923 RepID=H2KR52_CLOSI|nr:RNA pseudouridylate synthase domain-containing protein 2 [Clonorchis sinensis]
MMDKESEWEIVRWLWSLQRKGRWRMSIGGEDGCIGTLALSWSFAGFRKTEKLRMVHRTLAHCLQDPMETVFPKTKIPKCSKEEKKLLQKAAARSRRQERKRSLEDFLHYESINISDYYFENGLRKVFPYHFMFKAYVKRRWIDRPIHEVLLDEFNFPFPDIIVKKHARCDSGDLRVNDECISPDYLLRDSDMISHKVHRHEMPVLDSPIDFIHEDDDLLVINKPASIPVHPCGQYTLNSLTHILARQYDRRPLRFTHRLDRMTSGLMIIAKNYDASLRLATEISAREVKKYYICRVDGHFPDEVEDSPSTLPQGVIACTQPLGPLCSKMGLHAVVSESSGGKPACTHFKRLLYDPDTNTSLVVCRLFTGRTHQIRIHLQYLGYPITDDPLYNSSDWGDKRGKGAQYGVPVDEVIRRISAHRSKDSYLDFVHGTESSISGFDRLRDHLNSTRSALDKEVRDRLLQSFDSTCPECIRFYKDPDMKCLVLQLHAYRYEDRQRIRIRSFQNIISSVNDSRYMGTKSRV